MYRVPKRSGGAAVTPHRALFCATKHRDGRKPTAVEDGSGGALVDGCPSQRSCRGSRWPPARGRPRRRRRESWRPSDGKGPQCCYDCQSTVIHTDSLYSCNAHRAGPGAMKEPLSPMETVQVGFHSMRPSAMRADQSPGTLAGAVLSALSLRPGSRSVLCCVVLCMVGNRYRWP